MNVLSPRWVLVIPVLAILYSVYSADAQAGGVLLLILAVIVIAIWMFNSLVVNYRSTSSGRSDTPTLPGGDMVGYAPGGPESAKPLKCEIVRVFFATNRTPISTHFRAHFFRFFFTAIGIIISAAALVAAVVVSEIFLSLYIRIGVPALLAVGVIGCATYYARQSLGHVARGGASLFGGGNGPLKYGTCEVSIPPPHVTGQIERPTRVLFIEFAEDPSKHIVTGTLVESTSDECMSAIKSQLNASGSTAILVFVHGYNNTFADALRRTAQIAYDLDFGGVPFCFSWPSQGVEGAYTVDENKVDKATPYFVQALTDLATKTGAQSIHIIAHSMGNRLLASGLLKPENSAITAVLHELIFAAPDIDAEKFEDEIAPAIIRRAKRFTLYASSNDRALAKSMELHQDPRLGESGEKLVVCAGVDTIDASLIDTNLSSHSYYAEMKSVLSDVHYVIKSLPPAERFNLREQEKNGMGYWVFRP